MTEENAEGHVSLNSLVEQLDKEDQMVEDANAVLGGGDDDRCTFLDGYVRRQALYSCLTCRKAKKGVIENEDCVEDVSATICEDGLEDVRATICEDGVEDVRATICEDVYKNENINGVKAGVKNGKESKEDEDDEFLAGVCLACSLNCHEGHNLVELYTKRNFQCDCGNSKFPVDMQCKLCLDKPPLNHLNFYNQNFKGSYCNCSRPYPDPELEIEEDMIQCVLCEDWFHAKHLSESLTVDTSDYEELVCNKCMSRCAFLWLYAPQCNAFYEDGVFPNDDQKDKEKNEKIVRKDLNGEVKGKDKKETYKEDQEKDDFEKEKQGNKVEKSNSKKEECEVDVERSEDVAGVSALSVTTCPLKHLSPSTTPSNTTSPAYWPSRWRNFLCQCLSCKELYVSKEVSFLSEEGDSIWEYEEAGKLKRPTDLETPLSKLNHVQKIELIQGYTDLKVNLSNYLKKFAENGKVVRQEDINEFFEMQSRKRRKVSSVNQYFCK